MKNKGLIIGAGVFGVIAVIAIVAVAILVFSPEADGDESTTETTEASVVETDNTASTDPLQGVEDRGQIGEPIELAGERITVREFAEGELANTFLGEVQEGKRLVYIDVLFENVAGDTKNSSAAQFFIYDDTGEEYGPSFLAVTQGEAYPMIDVPVGSSNSGVISFEVDEGASGLYLSYAVDLAQGQEILVDLE